MNRRQKIIVSITGIFIVLLALVGLTYAYFLTQIKGNTNPTSVTLSTANLLLEYTDGNGELRAANKLTPNTDILFNKVENGEIVVDGEGNPVVVNSKTFSVENKGNETVENYAVTVENYSLTYVASGKDSDGKDVVAGAETTFKYPETLVINITCSSNKGDCNGVENGVFPESNDILLYNDIEVGEKHEYTLTMKYIDNGENQSADMNKTLSAQINIIDANNTVDLTGEVASYTLGDYVQINSEPKTSRIVKNKEGKYTYKLVGVQPDDHELGIYNDGNETPLKGSSELSIVKGKVASVEGNVITITDASREVIVDITSSYSSTIGEVKDFDPYKGILAMNFANGRNIDITTSTIVEDVDIKTQAITYPFSVTNVGNDHRNLTIKLTDINIADELKDVDFRWGLYNADTNVGLVFGTFKYVENDVEELIYTDTILDAATPNLTNNYILRIWVHNNGTAQTELLNKKFSAKIQVDGETIEYTPEECFTLGTGDYASYISTYDSSCGSNVVVPRKINDTIVTGIGQLSNYGPPETVFYVSSLILPNTITELYDLSVKGSIDSITLPESMKKPYGLSDGRPYSYINLPENLEYIPVGFGIAMNSIIIPGSIKTLSLDGPHDYGDLIIMDGVTSLDYAYNIPNKVLEIPKTVTSVSPIFLTNANNLEKIIVRNSSIPSGFHEYWNCSSFNGTGCDKQLINNELLP